MRPAEAAGRARLATASPRAAGAARLPASMRVNPNRELVYILARGSQYEKFQYSIFRAVSQHCASQR
jgi:hypothetical protein